eukprot:CAMPEP_0170561360 /NCGR_PEP_ID=MMETSP0211-20121228/54296_1 /TAXON_ID=311385 /ORGANISM="Pseudokeronopsis sp., Strain OXSARD2" /LENGTH=33 /DNA_ID= /DNA_START= /DNA_END= /DNA_ORIENTATION=
MLRGEKQQMNTREMFEAKINKEKIKIKIKEKKL